MPTIHVEFVDASTGQTFAVADLPPENLPESFERSTTMHLSDDNWHVIKAEPVTAAEFKQSGKLRLTMSRVMQMPVKNILYTLPTICDAIPAVAPNTSIEGRDAFRLHEDNWRQVEFISQTHDSDIREELQAVAQIYQNHSVPGQIRGFNKLHVRKHISRPITTRLVIEQVQRYLPSDAQAYEVIGYDNSSEAITGGFGFAASPFVIYGHANTDNIDTLALGYVANPSSISSALLDSLARLMVEHNLVFVDWVRVQLIGASTEALQSYFGKFG